jgi:hypothetical protein
MTVEARLYNRRESRTTRHNADFLHMRIAMERDEIAGMETNTPLSVFGHEKERHP